MFIMAFIRRVWLKGFLPDQVVVYGGCAARRT